MLIPVIILNLNFLDLNYQLFYFFNIFNCNRCFRFMDDLFDFTPLMKLLILSVILSLFITKVIQINTLGSFFERNLNLHFLVFPFQFYVFYC